MAGEEPASQQKGGAGGRGYTDLVRRGVAATDNFMHERIIWTPTIPASMTTQSISMAFLLPSLSHCQPPTREPVRQPTTKIEAEMCYLGCERTGLVY